MDRIRPSSVVCWQDRDFKVLRPRFTGISATSHVSRLILQTDSPPNLSLLSKSYNLLSLVLLLTLFPEAEVQHCNDRSGKKIVVCTGATSTNSLMTTSDDKILMWFQSSFVKRSSYTCVAWLKSISKTSTASFFLFRQPFVEIMK